MPTIHLETVINAPIERVFDLARSIDAHQCSAEHTGERAVAGVTSGLLGLGEEVTWEARHFGVTQRLRVKMTALDRSFHFQDVMLAGAFQEMRHDHWFRAHEEHIVMTEDFHFRSPLGILGRIADYTVLTGYMEAFLRKRNAVLKRIAESEEWERYLAEASADRSYKLCTTTWTLRFGLSRR